MQIYSLRCSIYLGILIGITGCAQTPTNPCDSVTCGSSQLCNRGECIPNCQSVETACGRICVDLKKSAQHCGGCNTKCRSGEVCK